ncbi:hypothetical protein BDF22DRAFT_778534 [Syncephalis plumigaleata]|nr:hypothetical protein BDF22DRAFT_778534 [Syncephalis plumigaleata]
MFSAYQSIFMPSVHGAQGNNIVPPHVTCGMVGLRPFYNSQATSASMIVRKRSTPKLTQETLAPVEPRAAKPHWRYASPALSTPSLPPIDPFLSKSLSFPTSASSATTTPPPPPITHQRQWKTSNINGTRSIGDRLQTQYHGSTQPSSSPLSPQSRTSRPHLPSPPISPTTPLPPSLCRQGGQPDEPQRKRDRRVRV